MADADADATAAVATAGDDGAQSPLSESLDCSSGPVQTKYCTAADIANEALKVVVAEVKPGAKILDLCILGDTTIEQAASKVYTKKEKGEAIRKGIAFPTSISVNDCCCNYSALEGDESVIKANDVVKVELGAHVDGFISTAGHTVVASDDPESAITGRSADVVLAAWTAAEAAARTLKVGGTNNDVTAIMNKAVEQFDCRMVHQVISHQLKQHVIDGVKCILSTKGSGEESVPNVTIEPYEVYSLDVLVSTGEGKCRERGELRPSVFRRDVEHNVQPKTALSRSFLNEVNRRFPCLPFSIRAIEDQRARKMGVIECLRHGTLLPYPVNYEKPDELVAQFVFTILLLPHAKKITGLPLTQKFESSKSVTDEDLKKLLEKPIGDKKAAKKAAAALLAKKAEEEGQAS